MAYRVMIAEDEDIIRRGVICSVNWHRLGCEPPQEAQNGQEALELIRTGVFDIVLMDINMPILGGLDVLEQSYQEFGYVAIMITGYSDFDYAQRALRYGTVDYLLKPIDIAQLEQAIQKACVERERRLAYTHLQQEGLAAGQTGHLLPQREKGDDSSVVVDRIIAYIEAHFGQKITLSMISKELFYSESFMTRRFKEEVGINFAEYLSRYRIQQALAMLRQGRARLSDIAAACGFSDYKYFNTVFKKYVGCSAKQYLKKRASGRVNGGHLD